MEDKINLIKSIFSEVKTENVGLDLLKAAIAEVTGKSTYEQHGKFYGGVYNGKKHFYSEQLLEALSIEKLENLIKTQIGI